MAYRSLILLSLCFLFSCKRSITGEGPVISKSIDVSGFSAIELSVPANVTTVIADTFCCIITAPANITEVLEAKVKRKTLNITSDFDIEVKEPVSIVISLPAIEEATVNGSGKIRFLNSASGEELELNVNGSGNITAKANVNVMKCNINGSGNIELSGSSELHRSVLNGSGDLKALEFLAEDTRVEINGSGNAEVTSVQELKAEIRGSGDVIYKGQPHLITEVVGGGSIKRAE